jgi:hypothetical protein
MDRRGRRSIGPKCLFQFCIERSQSVRRLFLQLRHCGSSAGVAHGGPRARVPDLVGSRLPSPYHFRARINLFKALRRHFRATPLCRQTLSRRATFCAIESTPSKDLAAAGARHGEQSEATQTRGLQLRLGLDTCSPCRKLRPLAPCARIGPGPIVDAQRRRRWGSRTRGFLSRILTNGSHSAVSDNPQ